MNGGLLEVGQVHGYLGLSAHQKPRCFHKAQTARREANCLSDFFGDVNVRSIQENVVRDKKLARPDYAGSRGLVQPTFAEVWLSGWDGNDLLANDFELSSTNILEILPLRRSCGCFVEVNRNLKTLPDLLANVPRHGDTVFNADTFDRDEWDDVGGAKTGMCAFVCIQIDQLRGPANAANRRFLNRLALANQRDHAAVVISIHFAIKKENAVDFHRSDDRVNFRFVASFRKIRNAFDEGLHTRKAYPVAGAFAKEQEKLLTADIAENWQSAQRNARSALKKH